MVIKFITMGNSQVIAPQSGNQYLHSRLGVITLLKISEQEHIMQYELVLESQKLYEDWIRQLEAVRLLQEDVLLLPISHRFKQTSFCGTGGVAVLTYQQFLYSLEPEIANRRDIKRPFNEQELLYLFYSLVKLEALLASRGLVAGDIKPENVLVNEDGYVKVLSGYSFPCEPNRIIGGNPRDSDRYFPSPEELNDQKQRRQAVKPVEDLNACEIFSIGLTILQAGTLKDCSQIYGFTSEYIFSQIKLRQFLEIFDNRYSQEFSYLITEMLQPNPKRRIKPSTLYDRLRPYEEEILNLEKVEIKIPNYEFIPRVDREEKISIRKLGESQGTHLLFGSKQESVKYGSSIPISNSKQSNYGKVSLKSSYAPPYASHIGTPEPNPFSKSLQTGPPLQRTSSVKAPHYLSQAHITDGNGGEEPRFQLMDYGNYPDNLPSEDDSPSYGPKPSSAQQRVMLQSMPLVGKQRSFEDSEHLEFNVEPYRSGIGSTPFTYDF